MRTLIRASWVVGFDGQSHVLIRDGVVVYEDDTIVAVGHQFDGQVDRTVDATNCLVSPGLINCHLHFGSNARHIFLLDATRADATTVMDVGTRNPEGVVALAGELGARVYIGPRFRTWTYGWDERGHMTWDPDPHSGEAGLRRAVEFARHYDGT